MVLRQTDKIYSHVDVYAFFHKNICKFRRYITGLKHYGAICRPYGIVVPENSIADHDLSELMDRLTLDERRQYRGLSAKAKNWYQAQIQ